MAAVTKESLLAEIEAKKARVEEIEKDSEGERFDDVTRSEWNTLNSELDELNAHVAELDARKDRLERLAEEPALVEPIDAPQIHRPRSVKGADIWNLDTIDRVWGNPAVEERQLRDRSLQAIEKAKFAHPTLNLEDAQEHLERLLGDGEGGDRRGSDIARHVLVTGSPTYKAAFSKKLMGVSLTREEDHVMDLQRTMSLTGASGGVAVPFVLDPTLLPSYNGAVNPYRAIADVRQITVDEWRGVTSGGITAAFQAEAAATTDQSPTLASVSISTEMARVNIPHSIEISMDWASFASEMATEIQNSKDVLEASKFAVGSGTNEPFGVTVGATTLFTTSDSAALYTADFYGWHDALPPLYRSRGVFAMNNATLTRLRQLDTAGGSAMLTPTLQLRSAANVGSTSGPDMLDGRANVDLFGKPVYESTGIVAFADNALIGVFGAFNPYFKIIDRVGLAIVDAGYAQDATTGFPTGQKFILAYWRVGSKVVAANAFRTLRVA